jgi:hypothetical protein
MGHSGPRNPYGVHTMQYTKEELFAAIDHTVACVNHFYETGEDGLVQAELGRLVQNLSPGARAGITFQALTAGKSDTTLTWADKERILALAEEMGPDWAQFAYRFMVLVTKLA